LVNHLWFRAAVTVTATAGAKYQGRTNRDGHCSFSDFQHLIHFSSLNFVIDKSSCAPGWLMQAGMPDGFLT
jgi:hypothetical protein